MPMNIRSVAQQERHAEARRNKGDRRKLIQALKKQEAALQAALRELRAVLKELDA